MRSSKNFGFLISLLPLTGGADAARQFHVLSGETGAGQPYWSIEGGFASARPAAARGVVYAIDTQHVVRAYSAASQRELWSTRLPRSGRVLSTDIVIARGTVVVGDGWLFGLDAHSGAIRWTHTHGARSGDLELSADDSTIYAGSYLGTGELFAISATSGRQRWSAGVIPPDSVVLPGERVRVFGPVLQDGVLHACYVWWRGRRPRWVAAGGLAAVDANTGRILWSRLLPKAHPRYSTFCAVPGIAEDVVVTSTLDGHIHALDRRDGAPRWTAPPVIPYEANGLPNGDSRPVASNGSTIVAGSGTGTITAFRPDGRMVWQHGGAEHSGSGVTYAFSMDKRYAYATRITGRVSAIRLDDGATLWETGRSELYFATRIHGDTLYAVGRRLSAIRTR